MSDWVNDKRTEVSLFSPRNKMKISGKRKKGGKASSKLSIILVHSVFEDMEDVSLAICTADTEYIFVCFCNHGNTASTYRPSPLPITAKLYQ